jgi:hypothetical protein
MSQIRFSGRAVMSLILTVVSVVVVIIATKWPWKAALFPVSIGIAVFILWLIALILILAGKGDSGKKGAVDFQLSSEVDAETATRRTLVAFAWIVGFFLLILFFGFPIAVVLFVFLYLKFQGKEKWSVTLLMTLFSAAFFWGLFVWILDTLLPEGLVFQGLRSLGIGG